MPCGSRWGISRLRVARSAVGVAILLAVGFAQPASAQNLLEFLFGGGKPRQAQPQPQPTEDNPITNFFADPFGLKQQQIPPPRTTSGGSGPAFCVRNCDGKFFALARGNAAPVQMCQAFCPAAATRVYFGSRIEDAVTESGERYADEDNAFAFRKALRSDCTCNGKSPAGLAPVDLSLDASLRPGDVVATANGLVAYTGRGGGAADFTPVASYPGLTSEVRSRLGEMKVAPSTAEAAMADTPAAATPAPVTAAKSASPRGKRAEIDARQPPVPGSR